MKPFGLHGLYKNYFALLGLKVSLSDKGVNAPRLELHSVFLRITLAVKLSTLEIYITIMIRCETQLQMTEN